MSAITIERAWARHFQRAARSARSRLLLIRRDRDRLAVELKQARAREKRVRDFCNGLADWGNTALHDQIREGLRAALDTDERPAVMSSADEAQSYELICEAARRWGAGDLTAEDAIEAVLEQVGD